MQKSKLIKLKRSSLLEINISFYVLEKKRQDKRLSILITKFNQKLQNTSKLCLGWRVEGNILHMLSDF